MQIFKNKKVIIMFGGWACALVLLLSFTCASFAKYVSGKVSNEKSDVASFACSIQVDAGVSTTLFLNSEYATYIYGENDSQTETVINPPQTIDFSVLNYVGEYVAEVAVNYSLVFYIPVVFSKAATVQITKDDDTVGVTPLYVLDKFLDAAKEKADSADSTDKIYVNTQPVTRTTNTTDGKISYDDEDYVSTDLQDSYIDNGMRFTKTTANADGTTTIVEKESTYGAVEGADHQVFECTEVKEEKGEVTAASFQATDGSTVTVEKIEMESTVVRGYSTYKNTTSTEGTTSAVTTTAETTDAETTDAEKGLRLANIYLTTTAKVDYYKFTIYHSSFETLPAGSKTELDYSLRMSLTKGLSNVDSPIDADYNTTTTPWTKFLEPKTVGETTEYSNITTTDGWAVSVNEKKEVTLKVGDETYENVLVESLDVKTYPCRLNALFEQTTGTE